MIITFQERKEVAPSIWEYIFAPEKWIDYVPGQYVDIQLEGVAHDPRGSKRVFTLTSLPDDKTMSFITKFTEPMSPYKAKLDEIRKGSIAHIGDAMGDLILPKDTSIPLVFIAGGIGIASYISMLKQLSKSHEHREIHIYYAVRRLEDRIYKEFIRSLPFKVRISYFLSPERIKADNILEAVQTNSLVYLSGSEQFVEELRYSLESKGLLNEQIIYDFFDGYNEL